MHHSLTCRRCGCRDVRNVITETRRTTTTRTGTCRHCGAIVRAVIKATPATK